MRELYLPIMISPVILLFCGKGIGLETKLSSKEATVHALSHLRMVMIKSCYKARLIHDMCCDQDVVERQGILTPMWLSVLSCPAG